MEGIKKEGAEDKATETESLLPPDSHFNTSTPPVEESGWQGD
jgi:hypothetical protein